jgi:acyl phosphate:glycerol-3-phosphate acyltransferase
MLVQEALAIIIGYILGSIPTAYIAGRIKRGEDIRQLGGGNVGAANAARELGFKIGLVVLMVDVAKGAGAILAAKALEVSIIFIFLAGFAAVAGHCWPVWLKFRGGKGGATTIGVFLALAPLPFLCAAPIAILVIYFTSNVVLGMAAGFLFSLLFFWLFGQTWSLIIYAVLMFLFLAVRYAPTALRSLRKAGSARNFLIDKNYRPWQTRKK